VYCHCYQFISFLKDFFYHTVVSRAAFRVAGMGEIALECLHLCQPDPFFSEQQLNGTKMTA
jgi:hypothetical protein